MLYLLQSEPAVWIACSATLGLVIGSFLNVVIHRLPRMMQQAWQAECRELMQVPTPAPAHPAPRYNLVVPRSRCPRCGHCITALENLPVLSYLLLGGRCSACRGGIPLRYPAVELLSGAACAHAAWYFHFGWQAGAAMVLCCGLIGLAGIDLEHQLLPDIIVLPLLWLGLLLNMTPWGFSDLHAAVAGAVAGYLFLWAVYHLFLLLTGKEGLGYGDFKLLALFGAWLGWQALPQILLLASLAGAVTGGALILLRRHDWGRTMPFGPFLAGAGWLTLYLGERLLTF